jgi:cytochrome c oxidase cbb3-type subunit 4
MEAGLISSVVTVVFFVLFIAIIVWAFYSGNKKRFEDAGNLPFQEDASETRKPD